MKNWGWGVKTPQLAVEGWLQVLCSLKVVACRASRAPARGEVQGLEWLEQWCVAPAELQPQSSLLVWQLRDEQVAGSRDVVPAHPMTLSGRQTVGVVDVLLPRTGLARG